MIPQPLLSLSRQFSITFSSQSIGQVSGVLARPTVNDTAAIRLVIFAQTVLDEVFDVGVGIFEQVVEYDIVVEVGAECGRFENLRSEKKKNIV